MVNILFIVKGIARDEIRYCLVRGVSYSAWRYSWQSGQSPPPPLTMCVAQLKPTILLTLITNPWAGSKHNEVGKQKMLQKKRKLAMAGKAALFQISPQW